MTIDKKEIIELEQFSEWKLESDWRKLYYDIAQSLAITNLQ